MYIGSAVDLSKRFLSYYSPLYLKRANNYICNALTLHSHSAFSLSIVEYIDLKNLSLEEARNLILEREQYYLDSLLPKYNILKVAGSLLGYKHTQESLIKISEANKGISRNKGIPKSPETKALMSLANKGKSPFAS